VAESSLKSFAFARAFKSLFIVQGSG